MDWQWWIVAVELPALGGLFLLLQQTKRDFARALEVAQKSNEIAVGALRDSLAVYKLEVAKQYASTDYLKDVERRLTNHLVRIEERLDVRPSPLGRHRP